MKERPILFSAPMVRAILAGTKTQTRRTLRVQPPIGTEWMNTYHHPKDAERPYWWAGAGGDLLYFSAPFPYGRPGDRLWVRETWQHSNFPLGSYDDSCQVFYRADYMDDPHGPDGEKSPEGKYRKWMPSIHMPRSASRIMLEITAVRVERLQDISDADAIAEGIQRVGDGWERFHVDPDAPVGQPFTMNTVLAYRGLWDRINGPESWDANPWVWVIEFNKI